MCQKEIRDLQIVVTNLVIRSVEVLSEGIPTIGIDIPVRPFGDRRDFRLGHCEGAIERDTGERSILTETRGGIQPSELG